VPAPRFRDADRFIRQCPPKQVGSVAPMCALITRMLDSSGPSWTAEHVVSYWYLLNVLVHEKSTHFLSITGTSALTGPREEHIHALCIRDVWIRMTLLHSRWMGKCA